MKTKDSATTLNISLLFAKDYFEMLCEMRKKYTIDEIQESKELKIMQKALWTSLIIEMGRLFDTYETKNKKVISLKKIQLPEAKKEIDKIHGEAIIGKIINTRNSFTAHWGVEKNKIVGVTDICNSNLGILLNKLDKPLALFEEEYNKFEKEKQ